MKGLCVCFLSLTLLGNAHGMTLESFKNQRNTFEARSRMDIYLIGVGQGFTESNEALMETGRAPLFCPPERYRLSTKIFVDIIKDMNSRYSLDSRASVSDVLLDGLIEMFPC